MTQVTIGQKGGRFSVSAKGHATGSPELCAAVSCLMSTLAGWLRNGEGIVLHRERLLGGDARLEWSGGGARSEAVFEAVWIGFLQLEMACPTRIVVTHPDDT